MTTPHPSPQPSASSGNPAIDALANAFNSQNVSGGTTTSSTDLFGLGDWGTQTVNPGDLPILGGLIGTGKKTTGNAIIKAFGTASPTAVAQIQRALYLGGYYSSKTYSPSYGVVKPDDITAFGDAVRVAGQTQQSVADVLLQGAQYGTVAGVAAARAQQAAPSAATATINLPNTQDLEAEAVKAFNAVLGHNANPKQAAAFAAMYRSMSAGMQRANNQAQYDAQATQSQGGLSGKQVKDLTGQAQNAGQLALQPYKGPETQFHGDFVTGDGEIVGYQPIPGNSRLGPMIGATHGNQLVVVDPQSPNFGQPWSPDVGFSQEMQSLGATAQQAQQEATPPIADSGLTQVDQQTPESPDVAAQNFAQNVAPKRYAAKSLAGQFDALLSILGSTFGG